MNISPLFAVDFYKISHYKMYPEGTEKIYSNLTPRKSRVKGINKVAVFGIQYLIIEFLIKQWNEGFFNRPKAEVIAEYERMINNTLGVGSITSKHIEDLHDLGYLPIKIKALPEGSLCPIGVPMLTITNTVNHAYWLVNYLETLISLVLWKPITSATLAYYFKKLIIEYADKTCDSREGIEWLGHDFSLRGMDSIEAGAASGAGHLLSFTGTDTIPAICFLEQYYGANVEKELIGSSVPATEHSVMCLGTKEDEIATFKRLLEMYPDGILSVVSDTWNLWKVCTEFLPELKELILSRNGKLVIRPDSGDPVDIICGKSYKDVGKYAEKNDIESAKALMAEYLEEEVQNETPHGERGDDSPSKIYSYEGKYYQIRLQIFWNRFDKQYYFIDGVEITSFKEVILEPSQIGVVELLWDVFGGTVNSKGYKVLDSHIGAIYGDSITEERAKEIYKRLEAKGFASSNIVFGIGSFTYQYNTRDTFGFAIKATYGEVLGESRNIFKNPITDDGTKKSAKGLLCVRSVGEVDENNRFTHRTYELKDQASKIEENEGALVEVFNNGKFTPTTLEDIRHRLSTQK